MRSNFIYEIEIHIRQTAQSAGIHKPFTANPSVLSLHLLTLTMAILQLETRGYKPGKGASGLSLDFSLQLFLPSSDF